MPAPATVEEYIASADPSVRERLERLRAAVRAASPDGAEKLRYGMPAIELAPGVWLHIGAWKDHIGVYPVHAMPGELEERVRPYRTTPSTLNLPLDEPAPVDLIGEVAQAIAAGAPR